MRSIETDELLAVLSRHAEKVLRIARGRGVRPALLVDAVDVATHQPPTWLHPEDGRPLVLSNFANQQDFFRLLDGLTTLTGDDRWRAEAESTTRDVFDQCRDASGLLHWGGHAAVDVTTGEAFSMSGLHELKSHYPYYDLLWRVDSDRTRSFVMAFWHRHVLDWSKLDLNRHGEFGPPTASLEWPELETLSPVFFESEGLSFINTGSDLFYAGALLANLSHESPPQQWAQRLARRYAEETRHPQTGLGGYQFSMIAGDRAEAQLGPEFGERAREHSVLDRTRAMRKFAVAGLCQLELAERLGGAAGAPFLQWAVSDLTAYARHAYDPDTNLFHAVLRDGTRLGPADIKRPGYYSPETFRAYRGTPLHFWAYARAFRLSGDAFLAQVTADLARGCGLGRVFEGKPEIPSTANDAWTLLGLLELHRARAQPALLRAAEAVAINTLRDHCIDDLFVENAAQRYARVGRPEPLALLHLIAALKEQSSSAVPAQLPGEKYFTAHWHLKRRTSDYLEWFPSRHATR